MSGTSNSHSVKNCRREFCNPDVFRVLAFIILRMDINWIGPAAAVSTFLGIWIGHVSVRKIEREVERIWIPTALALALGTGLELISLWTDSRIRVWKRTAEYTMILKERRKLEERRKASGAT